MKRKARKLHKLTNQIADDYDYDCGHNMLMQVSPSYIRATYKFEAVMKELRNLDPQAPA